MTTPQPAAGSEELSHLEDFRAVLRWCYDHGLLRGEFPQSGNKESDILDAGEKRLEHLITAQNDAIYAKVMEAIKNLSDDYIEDIESWKYYEDYTVNAGDFIRGYNIANRELRQSIAKIFGKVTI